MWRGLVAALAMLLPTAALADDWTHYVDEKYGYEIDIPSGFERVQDPALGPKTYHYKTAVADLFIDTSYQKADTFEADELKGIQTGQEFFHTTVLDQVITPVESLTLINHGDQQVRTKKIVLCGRDYVTSYQLQYFAANAALYAPVTDRLDRSFKRTETC
jgi:hypothetical protein